jgi:hypothetical protein
MSEYKPTPEAQNADVQLFEEIANRRVSERNPYPVLEVFFQQTHGMDSVDKAWSYAEHAKPGRVLHSLFASVYPEADDQEIRFIAARDACALVAVQNLWAYARFDPSNKNYVHDKWPLDRVVEPADWHAASSDESFRLYFTSKERINADLPAYAQRLEHGMPRVMQLFMAAATITRLSTQDEGWRRVSAAALPRIQDLWYLNHEELMSVTGQASRHSHTSFDIPSIILSNTKLAERYASHQEGNLDVEAVGGAEKLAASLQKAFRIFVSSNGDSVKSGVWNNAEKYCAPYLENLLPLNERKALVRQQLQEKPFAPSEQLAEYVSARVAETVILSYLFENLPAPAEPPTRREWVLSSVAKKLGCPEETQQGLRYLELRSTFDAVEQVATVLKDESTLDMVRLSREKWQSQDPELVALLKAYQSVLNGVDLDYPIWGWTGASEEDAVAKELVQRQEVARANLRQIEEQVNLKLDSAPTKNSFM